MLKKNIEKEKRKQRKTWVGLYTRKTPTKKELIKRSEEKHKKNNHKDGEKYDS